MNYRQLGNTGISVSELGFGCHPIGSDTYGPTDDYTSRRALFEALQSGITFFDTADSYGNGHSEELLGTVFAHRRQDIVIATKGGMASDFTPAHLICSLDASLRRLQTDYIDLYQLDSPSPADIYTDNILDTLHRFKLAGKIRAVGVSVRNPSDALRLIRDPNVDCIQVDLSLIDQRAVDCNLLDNLRNKQVGFIASSPLASGFLTNRYAPGTRFHPPDHRADWDQERVDILAQSPKAFDGMTSQSRGINHLAILYGLSYRGVSSVVVGMANSVEVAHNVEAIGLPALTAEEREEIGQIYQEHRQEWGKF